jgi:ATP-binding protein involved in chromosome partitioning|tara:strand:+ start:155 stop:1216 length:1062 start_codon:yes stop_codon:yes gene_type:complete
MEKTTQMTQEEIQNILKEIKYPGFNRDIVSFGMVKNISVSDNAIDISLQINSQNEDLLNQLTSEIKSKFISIGENNVNIHIQKPQNQPVQSAGQQNPVNQQSIPGVKHIIAIASGKGGVGKSTVSINIAAALSKNYKVGVLDLDIYGPSLPMLVNLHEQPEMTAEKKLIPLEKFNMRLMSFGFINSENAPAVWRGPMVSRMTQQFFEDVVWGELDYLILDLPPGTGDIQLTLVQKLAITGAVMVTTPQELALLDVKKGADMFGKVNTPVMGVIENMTHFLCPHCNEASRIFPGSGGADESKRLEVPLLGQIYLSPEIAQSADNGTPFVLKYEDSPITAEYMKIAQQLVELAEK